MKLSVLRTVCFLVVAFFFVYFASSVSASTLTAASVTMSNSRMSFKAPISSGAAGDTKIITTAAVPDLNTNHLFPGDKVCFTDAGNNVCRDNTTYTVNSIVGANTFEVAVPLVTALTATDFAVASQSGTWTISATTVNTVPIGGKLVLTIPANTANTAALNNDGMPDSNATVLTNGFDMNKLAVGNATVTAGCTPANWGTAGVATSITVGNSGSATTISWTRATATCAGGSALTIQIAGNGIVNPAPITGHVQGTSDVYGVTIATQDSGSNVIDSAVPRVAPVEAVLISATVDESLSFVITGVSGSHCGTATTTTATATSIPWGHFAATNTFYYAAQNLVVSTNANSGYTVTLSENDQMGRNGNVCTGTTPTVGDYTFSSATCIRDTVCSAATPCTEAVMGDWPAATNFAGLGYTLATTSGTTAATFYYNQGGRTWNAKELADIQGGRTAQTIMSSTGPVNGDSIDVCYKITIPGTQPSGYYYNIAKYTATATF